jgi:UDP-N-acetylmuramate dehydrogenase
VAIAQSGAMLNTLVNQSIEHSFAGMEELSGIPGTVGGAVVMNAGAFSMCVEETVEWVRYFDIIENKIIIRTKNEMNFGYRKSYLKDRPAIVLNAAFRFTKKRPVDDLIATRSEIQSKRKIKQPLEYPNCGSVFKRPVNNFAGTLIEKCGLKGKRIGDVEVSVKHANFIVNRGNGTAEDVRNLIILIQKNVYENSGILLEPEVIFIGSFANMLFSPD